MFRFWSVVRVTLVGAIFASWSAAAVAADPLTLFLLRMLRDQVISTSIQAGVESAQERSKSESAAAAVPRAVPPPATEGQWLKGLIDESFVHLGPQQREELHASLMRLLNDPKNESVRPLIISEFTGQAIAIRDAHRALSRLSEADMKVIVANARREYERLPSEQRQQMLQVLQHGVPGMPRTLNDLMLAEFSSAAAPR